MFVQGLVEAKRTQVNKIGTDDNFSDVLTKYLDISKFQKFLAAIGIVDTSGMELGEKIVISAVTAAAAPKRTMPWKTSAVNTTLMIAATLLQPTAGMAVVPHDYKWREAGGNWSFFCTMMVLIATVLLAMRQVVTDVNHVIGWRAKRHQCGMKVDVAVQTDPPAPTPPTSTWIRAATASQARIWISPSGERYHVQHECGGLRGALRTSSRTPCLLCCA